MLARTLQSIGILTLLLAVVYEYAPGAASRLGVPYRESYECPGSYVKLPGADYWEACETAGMARTYEQRGWLKASKRLKLSEQQTRQVNYE